MSDVFQSNALPLHIFILSTSMNEARREIVWKHRKFSNTKTQIFAQLTIYKLEHLFKFLPLRAAIYLLAVWCVCSRFATAGCVVVLTHRERGFPREDPSGGNMRYTDSHAAQRKSASTPRKSIPTQRLLKIGLFRSVRNTSGCPFNRALHISCLSGSVNDVHPGQSPGLA